MAKRPRTMYSFTPGKKPQHGVFIAKVTGYGELRVPEYSTTVFQLYHGKQEFIGSLFGQPKDLDNFKLLFDHFWTSISPWETYAYDINIYDRLGRSLGTATEFGPVLAKRRARELMEQVNGTSAVILLRNRKTLEVSQLHKLRRRPTRPA